MNIFQHNVVAYEKVKDAFNKSKKTCVVQPTGTGKSYVALQLIRDNTDKRFLYLTSYASIRSQFIELISNNGFDTCDITYGIYMNSKALAGQQFDFIILDEFHRVGAEHWGMFVQEILNANPDAFVLGLSATPVRHSDDRDMSDELFNGNIASEMSLAEAIVRHILPTPTYVTCLYSLQSEYDKVSAKVVKLVEGERKTKVLRLLQRAKGYLEQSEGLPAVFKQWVTKKSGKYIAFCKNIDHLNAMCDESDEWLSGVSDNIHKYIVFSSVGKEYADEEFTRFKNDTSDALKVLFCVNMFNEGVHLSDIDGVFLLRPTESPNVYLQQVGRALDTGGTKPLIIDVVGNVNCLRESVGLESDVAALLSGGMASEFDCQFKIVSVMKDFVSLLEEINSYFTLSWDNWFELYKRAFSEGIEVTSSLVYNGYNLGSWLVSQKKAYKRGTLSQDSIAKLSSVNPEWYVSRHRKSWDVSFELYKQAVLDGVKVDTSTKYQGYNVGSWLSYQRNSYRHGLLAQDKVDKLSLVNPEWCVALELSWDTRFELYKQALGDGVKVVRGTVYKGYNLGNWEQVQRQCYKNGTLSQDKIDKLNSVGFMWESRNSRWDFGLDMYKQAIDDGVKVVSSTVYKGYRLGCWVSIQRRSLRAGVLSQDRVNKLNSVNPEWCDERLSWDSVFGLYKQACIQGINVNTQTVYKGYNLGTWVQTQRKRYKRGVLSQDRINKLSSANPEWCGERLSWDSVFELYRQACTQGIKVNTRTVYNGYNLGVWVRTQRTQYNKGVLAQDRIDKLNSVGFDWVYSRK